MKQRRSIPKPPGRGRRRWIWGIACLLLVLGGAWALKRSARGALPPPPMVDTVGFDPVIAQAISQAREAVQTAPSSALARGQMGMVLLAHDVRAPASECFAQACALAPQEPRWRYLLGLAQLPDRPAAAATNFALAVRLVAQDQDGARLRLADTLVAAGRAPEAEPIYRDVLRREPNSARALLGLGKVVNASGRAAEASELLVRAGHDACTRKAAHRLLVGIYQRLGRTSDSEALARALRDLPNDLPFPDPILAEVQGLKTGEAAWIDLGDEWIKSGRVADAAQLLEKTVQTYPKSDRAMFLLGRARFRMGDPAGAETILRQSVQLAPGSVEAQVQLGVIQLARGQTKEAQRAFRAAIQANPNVSEAWFNLGFALGNENAGESVAAFREAIRLKPNFPEAYLGLAVVLRAQGQNQAAAAELKQALELHGDGPLKQKLLDQLKLAEPR